MLGGNNQTARNLGGDSCASRRVHLTSQQYRSASTNLRLRSCPAGFRRMCLRTTKGLTQ
ncbi:hypothetical protein CU044_0256 [Streptomyces sp. L-9-10]|nr:hypothetical protein CU044_0256 [Streptomyces sp. L-9-10]